MRTGEGAPADEGRELAIDDEIISLRPRQLDFLLEALSRARGSDAAAVREDIGALRLIPGTIRLLPTAGELTALRTALGALAEIQPRPPSGLTNACHLDGRR